jgi:hypothetical protein
MAVVGGDFVEWVANVSGRAPPKPRDDGDNAKKRSGIIGCATDHRVKGTSAKSAKESEVSEVCMALEIAKTSATDKSPARFIFLKSASDILDIPLLAAFQSATSVEFLEKLPKGRLKDRLLSLIGQPGRKRITKLDHLHDIEIEFEITCRKNLGVRMADTLQVVSIEPLSLIMRNDFDASTYTGTQDASFIIMARDVYDIGAGLSLRGPSYRWLHQYVNDMPQPDFKRLFYDQPLPNQEHDGTTTLKDVLEICVHDPESGSGSQRKQLLTCTCISSVLNDEVALVGLAADIAVRTSCGVSFTFDQWHHEYREIISGFGNPCLEVCHGYVLAIEDSVDGISLTVRIVLARGNLPPFIHWPRTPTDALFQTNMQAVIPARCVVSVFQIKPMVLHTLAGCGPEIPTLMAKPPSPIEWDVYVAGHLDFDLGGAHGNLGACNPNDRLLNRYKDENTKHFALFSDFCVRGGVINGAAFQERHAPWKKQYLEKTEGCRHVPKASLYSVAPFSADLALRTIWRSARHLGFPRYGPYLAELRTAVCSFALSKTKKAKQRNSGKVGFNPNIPGSILLQLVQQFVRSGHFTPAFREGTVEATVDQFMYAEELMGSKDGNFNLGDSGIVQFCPPITFRLILYDPKRSAEDSSTGVDGRAEVTFRSYVAKDRHGADLAGGIYDSEVVKQEGEMPICKL